MTGRYVGSVLLIVLVFCVVLWCDFTFWVQRCDVRYDFHIKQCSVYPYLQLLVGVLMSYIICVCLRLVCPMHIVLRCVFVLFVFVLCTRCCQFLWIVRFWLPLRYSLALYFICCHPHGKVAIPRSQKWCHHRGYIATKNVHRQQ